MVVERRKRKMKEYREKKGERRVKREAEIRGGRGKGKEEGRGVQ